MMMMMIMKIFVLKFLITVWENFKENLKEVKRFFTHSENINDAINDVTSITFWLNIFRTTGFLSVLFYDFSVMWNTSQNTYIALHVIKYFQFKRFVLFSLLAYGVDEHWLVKLEWARKVHWVYR